MDDKFPNLIALLNDAEKVHVTWGFDQQQADPIHTYWDWDKARKELKILLDERDKNEK